MIDILTRQQTNGRFDIEIENGDLKAANGFDSAIFVSLFSDSRAPQEKVIRPENRRGWLANILGDRELGGLLWLVEQRRLTQGTVNEVVDAARKSLEWMLEDSIAKSIEVSGEIVPTEGIALTVVITSPDGSEVSRYIPLWEATGGD